MAAPPSQRKQTLQLPRIKVGVQPKGNQILLPIQVLEKKEKAAVPTPKAAVLLTIQGLEEMAAPPSQRKQSLQLPRIKVGVQPKGNQILLPIQGLEEKEKAAVPTPKAAVLLPIQGR